MDDLIMAKLIRDKLEAFEADVHQRRHNTIWYKLESLVLGWFNLPPRVLTPWKYRVVVDEFHFERVQ